MNGRFVPEITTHSASELMSLGVAKLVDVREWWEREINPTIPGAIMLPLYTVKGFCGALTPEEVEASDNGESEMVAMPALITMLNTHREKGEMLLCICRSGNRSKDAVNLLHALGYSRAFSVSGGVSAWVAAGLHHVHPESGDVAAPSPN